MKFITTTILILIVSLLFGQNIDLNKRLDYLKKHHLFVVKVEWNDNSISYKKCKKIETAFNNNIKHCLDTFWDVNDSILYIKKTEIAKYKKRFPNDLFLDYKLNNFYAFVINIPNSNVSFDDISPRPIDSDTTLLEITLQLRQLLCNVKHGEVLYRGASTDKKILILDEPALNNRHQEFIERYKKKYPNNFQIVTRQFIDAAVYSRDPRYVYIYRMSIINCADGSMIQI